MVGTIIIIMATITTIVDFRAVLAGPLAKRDGRKNNRRPIGACSVSAVRTISGSMASSFEARKGSHLTG
jgi:hypothetical protein